VRIVDVRCVEYEGRMDGTRDFWLDRLRQPTDVYPEYSAAGPSQLRRDEDGNTIVTALFLHIETDTGLIGSTAAININTAAVVLHDLRSHLIGMDPLATEKVWDVCYRALIHGRHGFGMMGVSAVDNALWDIKGQHFGVPAHVLLGGPTRDRVPAYVSTLGGSLEPDHVRGEVTELVGRGYRGMKWFPRWGPEHGRAGIDKVVELVGTIRDAAGPEVDIMLDAWSTWDVPFTVEIARATEDLRLSWIEEPLLADDTQGYRALRRLVGDRTRIVGAEHEYTRWGFARLVAEGTLDLYQADPHWAGGISELGKIGAVISAGGGQLIPHGQSMQCNAAVTFAASPALVPQAEYLRRHAVLYQHFLAHPIRPLDGFIAAPTLPGLGMALDESKVLARRTVDPLVAHRPVG
jgi:L-alanine-DL-glutamate epimerase-like enolase superfamily enzyme